MDETMYINKSRTLPDDQDFDFLRARGFEYIEDLSSKIWTDYNTHDPGITILEVLCYAITELGYRTDFNIKDLMADPNGNIHAHQAFFPADDILISAPLTVGDYRKILVDIVGIKNAWLYPYRDEDTNFVAEPDAEVPIFAECKKQALVYEETDHPVKLHGLYNVLLDLEANDEFGDLNRGDITYQIAREGLANTHLQILLPDWRGTSTFNYEFITAADPLSVSNLNISFSDDRWTVKFDVVHGLDMRTFEFQAIVLLKNDITSIVPLITEEFNDVSRLIDIFKIYQNKIKLIISILNTAKTTLHENRNLCEDFLKLETICTEEVAFCADIEVKADTDIEEVYANILFRIENYLNPEIKFYSLSELLAQGVRTEDIFEGPVLTHGFIKNEELAETQIRRKIYVSDIINFIIDTPGVLSVKNVLFTKYNDNGTPSLPSQRWCMEISEGCKPVLNIFKSKVLFFKGRLPFKAKGDETFDTLKYLRGLAQRKKLKGTNNFLRMPKGSYNQLYDYVSIQYDFPATYGIGNAGLPSTSTAERKAQAKQLKAYLLFYDQILANFFSQLANAKDLFSVDTNVNQTYFSQYLHEVSGIEDLYINALDLERALSKPLQGDSAAVKALRSALVEDAGNFDTRRNRFLDHLIARFAESFNEYVLMLYTYKNAEDFQQIEPGELIKDKISFLKDYTVISKNRGKAFEYLKPAWDNDNVSGLEKRLARLSGIDDFTRRFLFCIHRIEIQRTESNPPKYFFKVLDANGVSLLQSLYEYDSYAELQAVLDKLPDAVGDVTLYQNQDISGNEFSFEIWDNNETPLAESGTIFPDSSSRDEAVINVSQAMKDPCPSEGMHLVEHILLRPRFNGPLFSGEQPEDVYKLFHVCLGENCKFCGEEDPYSFRISLILPFWHDRFKSMEFRRYFENMVHTETPAHCIIKICWVSNTLMNEFERAYKEWMAALALYEVDLIQKEINKDRLRIASNAMVVILKKLHTEYPEARLHDCDTGVSNPVLLGNTVLGTYKF